MRVRKKKRKYISFIEFHTSKIVDVCKCVCAKMAFSFCNGKTLTKKAIKKISRIYWHRVSFLCEQYTYIRIQSFLQKPIDNDFHTHTHIHIHIDIYFFSAAYVLSVMFVAPFYIVSL